MRETKNAKKTNASGKLLTILGAVLCVVFTFTLICNLTIIIKGTLYPEAPPSVIGITPLVVLSGSMSSDAPDHIEVGDLIFVDKITPKELETGNIIAFMQGKTVITHRIIDIETDDNGKRVFYTKGDANNAPDQSPVMEDKLVGIYKSRIPKVGDFAIFLQTPLGMVLFIGVPLISFIIYDIIRRQRYAMQEKTKTEQMEAELERLRKLAGESK